MQLQAVMGSVYGNEAARLLMTLLAKTEGPVRYSVARRRLNVHPQEFQRAVKTLERMALIGRILEPAGEGDQYNVLLEPTFTGQHIVDLWGKLESDAQQDEVLSATLEFPSPPAGLGAGEEGRNAAPA